jgi:hypothetical protein
MSYTVDFNTVSTVGLESSPVAAALAGLRAHEARYFKNKYDHVFTVEPASSAKTTTPKEAHDGQGDDAHDDVPGRLYRRSRRPTGRAL